MERGKEGETGRPACACAAREYSCVLLLWWWWNRRRWGQGKEAFVAPTRTLGRHVECKACVRAADPKQAKPSSHDALLVSPALCCRCQGSLTLTQCTLSGICRNTPHFPMAPPPPLSARAARNALRVLCGVAWHATTPKASRWMARVCGGMCACVVRSRRCLTTLYQRAGGRACTSQRPSARR
jgi:hypothetical protein